MERLSDYLACEVLAYLPVNDLLTLRLTSNKTNAKLMGCLGLYLQIYRASHPIQDPLYMLTEAETAIISQQLSRAHQLVSRINQQAIKDLIYNPNDAVRHGFILAASLATRSRVALNFMKAGSVAVRPEFNKQLASVDVDCIVSCKFRKALEDVYLERRNSAPPAGLHELYSVLKAYKEVSKSLRRIDPEKYKESQREIRGISTVEKLIRVSQGERVERAPISLEERPATSKSVKSMKKKCTKPLPAAKINSTGATPVMK
jgi:hypothetical protein